ncbi:related to HHE domain protein [Fusarium fujikuroi IMI 58289]|uniref:Related to HHE domain protein n=1 Tax=Gibberella fujikuroi (strain CBS 195.34 / IMI 58289 / NRRL A-6831) TaxID=1279085 RepID=S0EFS9_GIBF5|nr:related to HHE domain protein [Fusarium fujikuroi IMI 58289]CCT73856.1 related to HHE domain protein [Fusarium fujikuroi IMI 58289]SCO09653.1 related to HHE domain protein [Fusarium fujikuroi]
MSSIRSIMSPQLRTVFRPQHFRSIQGPIRVQIATMSAVSNAIVKDHLNSTDHDHQQRFGNQFVWELARHSISEELVIYPAMEKYMGDKGRRLADEDREEHHQVKERLKVFQNLKSTDPGYVPEIKHIWGLLDKHIEDEENRDLPALEKALAAHAEDADSLAASFERTKHFVPTRSHPSAGESPPFETVMGLLAAPIDRLADMFRKFPDKRDV